MKEYREEFAGNYKEDVEGDKVTTPGRRASRVDSSCNESFRQLEFDDTSSTAVDDGP